MTALFKEIDDAAKGIHVGLSPEIRIDVVSREDEVQSRLDLDPRVPSAGALELLFILAEYEEDVIPEMPLVTTEDLLAEYVS